MVATRFYNSSFFFALESLTCIVRRVYGTSHTRCVIEIFVKLEFCIVCGCSLLSFCPAVFLPLLQVSSVCNLFLVIAELYFVRAHFFIV